MSVVSTKISITKPSEDPDFLKCMDYLMWVEWDTKSQEEWAAKWNTSSTQVWRWKLAWNKRGLMAACREVIGLNLFDDIRTENRIFVRRWHEVADVWMDLALHAKREDVRMTAIDRMYMYIIKPSLDEQPRSDSEEADYLDFIAKNDDSLDPMSVATNLVGSPDEEVSVSPSTDADDKLPVETEPSDTPS